MIDPHKFRIISECFLDLFLRWVKQNGPKTTADTLYYNVDLSLSPYDGLEYVGNWDDNTDNLKATINAYYINNPGDTGTEFYFLYQLDNPVGFDSNGYNSNGANLNSKFDYLSTGFTMDANISPFEISTITVDFGS